MKAHTKLYLDFFYPNHCPGEYIACEICGNPAVDIHHIESRGMGGSSKKDEIKNLMALCRSDHEKYGDKKQFVLFLKEKHSLFMNLKNA